MPFFAVEPLYGFENLSSARRVEHRRRFIENNDIRHERNYSRYRHSLLLPARELMWAVPRKSRHADGCERVVYTLSYFFRRDADIFGSESHILLDYGRHELVIRILKYHAHAAADIVKLTVGHIFRVCLFSEKIQLARGGCQYHADYFCKCAFAAAIVSENSRKAAALDFEVHRTKHGMLLYAVIFVIFKAQVFCFNYNICHYFSVNYSAVQRAEEPQGSASPVCKTGIPISSASTLPPKRFFISSPSI